ncbi:MAG: hypothetical protein KatS3mg001_243 [Candidatus Pacearchaeota archaeon]|nr:MAG: hypothetical protein KatS3mg001_243 [Candidatus Pacearchaeota archaeon]
MSEKIIAIGIIFIFLGISLLVIGSLISLSKGNSKTNFAIGGFIGPIPFGFFSNKKMFWIWLLIAISFLLIWFLLRRYF